MKKGVLSPSTRRVPGLLLCVALAVTGLVCFVGYYRVLTLIAALCAALILVLKKDAEPLRSPASVLLLLYVVAAGLSGLWAVSGKFFLREYSKIFLAAVLFLAVVLIRQFDQSVLRRVMGALAVIGAVYSFLSVEYVTTGISAVLLQLLVPGMSATEVTVEAGNRLTGIFAAPNPTATILAFSIFFTIYLMCSEEKKNTRYAYAAVLAMNAFTFLMLFSMAGTAFFALSLLVYLIAAGKGRSAVFIRMVEGAVPTLLWVFAAFPFLTAGSVLKVIPMLAMAGNVVTVILLERFVAPRLIPVLERHGKLAVGVIGGIVLLAVVYLGLALNLTNAYTFGDSIRRSVYLEPGEHTVTVDAAGSVNLHVISQNKAETIMHTNTVLYSGAEQTAVITVPEGSMVCYIEFSAEPGTVIHSASVDGGVKVKLNYPLLPDFIANRLQGLQANQNAIQRTAFFDDGIKLFLLHPLLGNGVGSFETALSSVQEFYYETKYIHNHYIQVLSDNGLLGFVPFGGALCAMAVLLWKRRKDTEWRAEYAALCAAMVMLLTHIAFEISMSNSVFLCYAFVTFALIIRCCKKPDQVDSGKGKKRKKAVAKDASTAIRCVCAVFPVLFAMTLCGNLLGHRLIYTPANSEAEYMENLALAARVDPYEKNDAKLSYTLASLSLQDAQYREQADRYAEELLQVQSNSIPMQITQYYLYSGQPEKAIDAAMAGAAHSASSPKVWNGTIQVLRDVLLDIEFSPLMYGDARGLTDRLLEYYSLLQTRNRTSMETIDLTLASKDFWGKILTVSNGSCAPEDVFVTLGYELFHSAAACDADQDGVPDQVTACRGAVFRENGSVSMDANGSFILTIYAGSLTDTTQVRIVCDDPGEVTVYSPAGQTTAELQIQDGYAAFNVSMSDVRDEGLVLQISSTIPQELHSLDIIYTVN